MYSIVKQRNNYLVSSYKKKVLGTISICHSQVEDKLKDYR